MCGSAIVRPLRSSAVGFFIVVVIRVRLRMRLCGSYRARRPITAVTVDSWLATRSRREAADELSVTHDELRATCVVVALGAAVTLAPRGRRANLRMLAGRNAGRHWVDAS